MEPDDFNDPSTEAADRRDNRTAVVVAVVAAVVVGIACGVLMASQTHTPQSSPKPAHSSVEFQLNPGDPQ